MNLKIGILDEKGVAYPVRENEVLTLGEVLSNVLVRTPANDPLRSYILANKIVGKDECDFIAEEIVYLKDLIMKSAMLEGAFYPYILGQTLTLLEKKDEKPV